MPRQSISLTEPNDEWLKAQVASKEYTSKSELMNDLIRRARQRFSRDEYIKSRIIKGEHSGVTTDSKQDILNVAKARLNV